MYGCHTNLNLFSLAVNFKNFFFCTVLLYQALQMAGCAPQEAIVMGDSVTADIAAANAAGVESILFTEGKEPPEGHGATYVARNYREALDILLAKAE